MALGELERSLLQRGIYSQFATNWLQRHRGTPEDLAALVTRNQEIIYKDFVDFAKAHAAGETLAPAKMLKQLDALAVSLEESKELSDAARGRSSRELQVRLPLASLQLFVAPLPLASLQLFAAPLPLARPPQRLSTSPAASAGAA